MFIQQLLTLGMVLSAPPAAQEAVAAIEKLPEAAAVLKGAGDVRVTTAPSGMGEFDAFWNAADRRIMINPKAPRSQGVLIASILFELHNAVSTNEMMGLIEQAKCGELTRDEYIQKIEWIEHQNALRTGELLRKGRALGIFPPDASLEPFLNFDDHFALQIQMGHSEWIGKRYDEIRAAG